MQTIIYRMDNNKILLHSTRNYVQYPVLKIIVEKNVKKNIYL